MTLAELESNKHCDVTQNAAFSHHQNYLFTAYVNVFATEGFVIAFAHCVVFVVIKGRAHRRHRSLKPLSHFPLTFI